jgi:hypothetical protein
MSTWHENLLSFSSEVQQSTDKFEKEAVESRLHSLAQGVQSLEEALVILVSVFEGKRGHMHSSYWMLDRIRESVNNRCRAIGSISGNKNLPSV